MIKLRPHHLLCTKAYVGKGYNKDFIENMNLIISNLKKPETNIYITFSTDNICNSCPNLINKNECISNIKVKELDYKVIKHFNIEEKIYNYSKLIKHMESIITEKIIEDICSTCEWYNNSDCKNILLSKNVAKKS